MAEILCLDLNLNTPVKMANTQNRKEIKTNLPGEPMKLMKVCATK